ncbi:hypothetical protein DP113_06580 [Brasilonema octagenarum UFV-E1]|uniref:Uncharacterized protein n=1 Tax=Brasilonema sennae CENA114 TaxID=415709 RepID=A0A856M8X0_9CYAN|nr:hypothetical protein DP114_06620 [Brasilonema sennae CENA114]QDL13974.1 hypothetical protein DP113_06580 [Brasilonema octagenarum UFV-E1]
MACALRLRRKPPAVATTVKARRLGCFPRQTLGEPQRQIPLSGNPPAGLAPQGAALRSNFSQNSKWKTPLMNPGA